MLEIIYEDEYIVAINKPHGLLVHRSRIATNTNVYALQMLRDQLNMYMYPIHRLDRKTSGVLLFAKNSESVRIFQKALQNINTQKRYLAITRGYFPNHIELSHPLINDKGKVQDASTSFTCLDRRELDMPFGKFSTSRYSLIEAVPKTGRMHQIRKHLSHLSHPIIGDRPHGCNKQNKLFLEKWDMKTMMLHAKSFKTVHPITKKEMTIHAELHAEFVRMISVLGFEM